MVVEPIKITIPNSALASTPTSSHVVAATGPLTSPNSVQIVSPPSTTQQSLITIPARLSGNKVVNVRLVSPSQLAISPKKIETAQSVDEITENKAVTEDDEITTKMTREHKNLQDSINSSKVLTEYFIEGKLVDITFLAWTINSILEIPFNIELLLSVEKS